MQKNGPAPDVLTFAGNGEPTAHPHFPEIIEDTLALRDHYFPNAKVSVLSNSTFIDRPAVFDALNKIDNNILKAGYGERRIHSSPGSSQREIFRKEDHRKDERIQRKLYYSDYVSER